VTGKIAAGSSLGKSLLSILAGLVIAGIIMRVSGYNPLEAFGALWHGATGLASGVGNPPNDIPIGTGKFAIHINRYNLAQSLSKMTPLLLCGLSVALGLRGGLFNIGAQGQMIVGALAGATVGLYGAPNGSLPPAVHVALVLGAGALAGAIWGAIPGLLKAVRGVHEVISTIMFNYIAINLATYLVSHNLKDPTPGKMAAQTATIAKSAWLNPFVPAAYLSLGLPIALFAAWAISFLIRRTALGYEIRAVGLGTEAARTNGIAVERTLVKTMAIAGALAGMAGAIEVMAVHHRYVQGVAANYGFDAIAVALLGGMNGGGVALAAFFFGALMNGASLMQNRSGVPDSIAVIVQAMVILFIGIRAFGTSKPSKIAAAVLDDERRLDDDPV
jgi:general nucleoside transport system permease protein